MALASIPELGPVALAARTETTVIGKLDDLTNVVTGERTLLDRLPNLGNPRLNWAQNSSVLRQEMSLGQPIRDASVDSVTTMWYPPVP
jgi:hypothetical protein